MCAKNSSSVQIHHQFPPTAKEMSTILRKAMLLMLVITLDRSESGSDFCGKNLYTEPRALITTDPKFVATSCSWTIKTPRHTLINVHFDKHNRDSCFHFKNMEKDVTYYSLCNQTDMSITLPINDMVVESFPGKAFVSLFYTSYVIQCSPKELKCANMRGDLCFGLYFCNAPCGPRQASCGNLCYDIDAQRCDGALQCDRGEDELGCNPRYCPDSIRCGQTSTCIKPDEICDGINHCPDRNDEKNCGHRGRSGPDEITFVLFLGFSVLIVVFLAILCKCTDRRERMRNLLESPLDVALPPFQGPGENESSDSGQGLFSEADFKAGGPVYEGYAQAYEDKKYNGSSSIFRRTEAVLFNNENDAINEELAAIATLKLSTDQCVGMRQTKSDPISKILFRDDIGGGESAYKGEDHLNPRPFKSDTDYYKII